LGFDGQRRQAVANDTTNDGPKPSAERRAKVSDVKIAATDCWSTDEFWHSYANVLWRNQGESSLKQKWCGEEESPTEKADDWPATEGQRWLEEVTIMPQQASELRAAPSPPRPRRKVLTVF
jgi:hypothetical protein